MEDHKTPKMQAEETLWIQYPWDRHTKREDEMPIVGSPMDLRSSEIAEVHTFKIDDDHPIVARWEEVALEIITKLRQANLPWVAVECFNRRQLDDESRNRDNSTIVITLSQLPARTESLDRLLEEIHVLSGTSFMSSLPRIG